MHRAKARAILAIAPSMRRHPAVTDRESPAAGQCHAGGQASILRDEVVGFGFVVVVLAAAIGLWATSLSGVDMERVTDIGLVSVTPPQMLVAIAIIPLGFVLALRLTFLQSAMAIVAVLVLLVVVHALPSIVEDAPRQSVAYLHTGFTEEIERTGDLLTDVDARFSWPMFFTFGALVTNVAGMGSAIELQAWAAPVLNLVYIVPLYVIYSALSTDRRLIWTALFIFVATNWVGQDYYSPQGFNYLLYLTILAVLLRWFRTREVIPPIRRIVGFVERRWPRLRSAQTTEYAPASDPNMAISRTQRAALTLIVVLLMGVSVASHQLTPFAILAAVIALTLLRRVSLVGLPMLLGVLIGIWISYMTVAYLEGHLASLLADVGSVAGAASENVTERLSGSAGHLFVVRARLVMTAALWLVAAAGAIRRFHHGHLDLEAITLAVVPFGLMALQAYGGEMLLRVYLFSLPFMAFLAAGLFFPVAKRTSSAAGTLALSITLVVLSVALMLTKHGNERADWVSADELAAADYLHAIAPAGSMLGTVSEASPLKYRMFEAYEYRDLGFLYAFGEPDAVADYFAEADGCAYLFVSRMQQATAEMYSGVPADAWNAARDRLIDSGRFSAIYENRHATILALEPAAPRCRGT